MAQAIELRKSGLSYKRISKITTVPSETIRRWCITFAVGNIQTPHQMVKKETKVSENIATSPDVKSLEKKIKTLEAQLKHETLRADFYNEMINVAEAKFNVPIRKKAGAKRS